MDKNKGVPIAVFSILNGMLGATVLVLPVRTLQTGYLPSVIVPIVLGTAFFFTASLIIKHCKNYATVTEAVIAHFNGNTSYGVAYDVFIAGTSSFTMITYFSLICNQLEGLGAEPGIHLGAGTFIFLLLLSVLQNYFHLGEKVMGFGFFTNACIIIFVLYVIFSAPTGDNVAVPVGSGILDLTSTLFMALSTHSWVFFVLRRTTGEQNFLNSVSYSYIFVDGLLWESRVETAETIEDYFSRSSWQVKLIEIVYCIHFMTVYPQILLVIKRRILQAFNEEAEEMTWKALLVFVTIIGIGFLVYSTKAKISLLIELNGAFGDAASCVFIPILLHLKCTYFNKNYKVDGQQPPEVENRTCQCEGTHYKSSLTKILELIFCIALMVLSASLAVYLVVNILTKTEEES